MGKKRVNQTEVNEYFIKRFRKHRKSGGRVSSMISDAMEDTYRKHKRYPSESTIRKAQYSAGVRQPRNYKGRNR